MKRFFTFLKTELKLSLRDMNMVIFAVIMPLIVFIILGIIYGTKPACDGADYTFLEQSFGAVSAVAVCAGGSEGTENSQTLPCYAGQPDIYFGCRIVHVYSLLYPFVGNADCGSAFVGSTAARLTFCFSWELGTYYVFDPFHRYACGRRGKRC